MTPMIISLTCALVGIEGEGRMTIEKDAATGYSICRATVGATEVALCPEAGANLYSIRHQGIELLRTPEAIEKLPGFLYGTPVLYPTPNRVRDAKLVWEDKSYAFPANDGTNFLHGLVHHVAWKLDRHLADGRSAAFECRLDFQPGSMHYDLFPFEHVLRLLIEVRDGAVKWTYTVDNTRGSKAVPFGFALHPWFLYQGSRAQTFLTIPAEHLMESVQLLPTGRLLPLDGTKFDARQPITLEGFVIDDVYFGMKSAKPTVIEFRDKGSRITLRASDDFTHLVVYTPAGQPWFCVENQTCSTDAHNLYHKGLKRESNLLVVPAGAKHSGWIEYTFAKD